MPRTQKTIRPSRVLPLIVIATVVVAAIGIATRSTDSRAALTASSAFFNWFDGRVWVTGSDGRNNFEVFLSKDKKTNVKYVGIYDYEGVPINYSSGCARANFTGVPYPSAGVICPINNLGIGVDGGNGNDTIVVDPKSELASSAVVYGGLGNDSITGTNLADLLYGESNDDRVGGGTDAIDGRGGNDQVVGGDNPLPDASGYGGDTLFGGSGNDVVDGGRGANDTVDGGPGGDDLTGGPGSGDRVSYATRKTPQVIYLDNQSGSGDGTDVRAPGSPLRDKISESQTEVAWGGSGDDSLFSGPDTAGLNGNAGNDRLVSVAGAQRIDGGDGIDTVNYSELWRGSLRASPVTVTLGDGLANDGAAGEGDNLRDIENLTGGYGADSLTGSSSSETIQGGPGNDRIDGGRGADVIAGNDGNDTADYSQRTGAIKVTLGEPVPGELASSVGTGTTDDGDSRTDADKFGSTKLDNVTSTTENVFGGSGADQVTGNARVNVIFGNGGADTVAGGDGTDVLFSSNPFQMDGDASGNELKGGPGADVLHGNNSNDTIRGGTGTDALYGYAGADWLISNDDDAASQQVGEYVDCGTPDPPNTKFDSGDRPVYEDWADVDIADAASTHNCENIAEPPPSESDFKLCDPAHPEDEACRDDF